MAILCGASTLTGPIVGAAIITLVKNVVSTYVERWNTLLGVIFVVVIMFMPHGLVPGCTQAWRRLRNRIRPRKTAGGAASGARARRHTGPHRPPWAKRCGGCGRQKTHRAPLHPARGGGQLRPTAQRRSSPAHP